MVVWGSLLAGAGFGGGLIIVVHATAQASPAAFPNGIGGMVILILLLICPAFALGAGLMAAGLIPDDPPREADPPAPQR